MSKPRPIQLTTKALVASKRGIFDRRSALGKSVGGFIRLVKRPFGDAWSDIMEARLLITYPWIVLHFSAPMVSVRDGEVVVSEAWRRANARVEALLADLQRLADVKPSEKIPTLAQVIQEEFGGDTAR